MSNHPITFREGLSVILDEMADIIMAKQSDYGTRNISEFGELGVLVRANDKLARLKHLQQFCQAPKNEAVDDTWLDLANYAVLAMMLRRGYFELPFQLGENHA